MKHGNRAFTTVEVIVGMVVLGVVAVGLGVLMRTIAITHQANQVSSQSKAYSVVAGQVAAHGIDPNIIRPIKPQAGLGSAGVGVYSQQLVNGVVTPTQGSGAASIPIIVTVAASGVPSGISGVTPVSEVQQIIMPPGATGGTFTLTWGPSTTTSLPVGATALQVSTALNQLASFQSVSGATVSGPVGGPYLVTWATPGAQSLITANSASLTYPTGYGPGVVSNSIAPSGFAVGSLTANSSTALSGTQRQNASGSVVVSSVIPAGNQDAQARGRVYGRTVQLAPASTSGATVIPPQWPGMFSAPIPSSFFNPMVQVSLILPSSNPIGTVYYFTVDGTNPSGTPTGPTGSSILWNPASPLSFSAPGSGGTGLPAVLQAVAVAPSGQVSAVAAVHPVVQLLMSYARSTGSVGSGGNSATQFTYIDLTGDTAFSGAINTASASYDPIVLSVQGSIPSSVVTLVYTLDGSTPTPVSTAYSGPFSPATTLPGWATAVTLNSMVFPASGAYASQYLMSPMQNEPLTRVAVPLPEPALLPLPADGNVAVNASIAVEIGGSPVVSAPSIYFDTSAAVAGVGNLPAVPQLFVDSSINVPSVGP